MALEKIISGGQTGVDRGALDAALTHNFPAGGWCPDGRQAEDGVISEKYPLRELPDGGYEERTTKNVEDSDGTAILYFNNLNGGTAQTRADCESKGRPYVLIDASTMRPEKAAELINQFIEKHKITALNVAGPRESKVPGAGVYAYESITALLKILSRSPEYRGMGMS